MRRPEAHLFLLLWVVLLCCCCLLDCFSPAAAANDNDIVTFSYYVPPNSVVSKTTQVDLTQSVVVQSVIGENATLTIANIAAPDVTIMVTLSRGARLEVQHITTGRGIIDLDPDDYASRKYSGGLIVKPYYNESLCQLLQSSPAAAVGNAVVSVSITGCTINGASPVNRTADPSLPELTGFPVVDIEITGNTIDQVVNDRKPNDALEYRAIALLTTPDDVPRMKALDPETTTSTTGPFDFARVSAIRVTSNTIHQVSILWSTMLASPDPLRIMRAVFLGLVYDLRPESRNVPLMLLSSPLGADVVVEFSENIINVSALDSAAFEIAGLGFLPSSSSSASSFALNVNIHNNRIYSIGSLLSSGLWAPRLKELPVATSLSIQSNTMDLGIEEGYNVYQISNITGGQVFGMGITPFFLDTTHNTQGVGVSGNIQQSVTVQNTKFQMVNGNKNVISSCVRVTGGKLKLLAVDSIVCNFTATRRNDHWLQEWFAVFIDDVEQIESMAIQRSQFIFLDILLPDQDPNENQDTHVRMLLFEPSPKSFNSRIPGRAATLGGVRRIDSLVVSSNNVTCRPLQSCFFMSVHANESFPWKPLVFIDSWSFTSNNIVSHWSTQASLLRIHSFCISCGTVITDNFTCSGNSLNVECDMPFGSSAKASATYGTLLEVRPLVIRNNIIVIGNHLDVHGCARSYMIFLNNVSNELIVKNNFMKANVTNGAYMFTSDPAVGNVELNPFNFKTIFIGNTFSAQSRSMASMMNIGFTTNRAMKDGTTSSTPYLGTAIPTTFELVLANNTVIGKASVFVSVIIMNTMRVRSISLSGENYVTSLLPGSASMFFFPIPDKNRQARLGSFSKSVAEEVRVQRCSFYNGAMLYESNLKKQLTYRMEDGIVKNILGDGAMSEPIHFNYSDPPVCVRPPSPTATPEPTNTILGTESDGSFTVTRQPTKTRTHSLTKIIVPPAGVQLEQDVAAASAAVTSLAAIGATLVGPTVALEAGRTLSLLGLVSRCQQFADAQSRIADPSDSALMANEYSDRYMSRTLTFPESLLPPLCFGDRVGQCLRGAVVAGYLLVFLAACGATFLGVKGANAALLAEEQQRRSNNGSRKNKKKRSRSKNKDEGTDEDADGGTSRRRISFSDIVKYGKFPLFIVQSIAVQLPTWSGHGAAFLLAGGVNGADRFFLGFLLLFGFWLVPSIVFCWYLQFHALDRGGRQRRRSATSPSSPSKKELANNNNNNNASLATCSCSWLQPSTEISRRDMFQLEPLYLWFPAADSSRSSGAAAAASWKTALRNFVRSRVGLFLLFGEFVWSQGSTRTSVANGQRGTFLFCCGSVVNKFLGPFSSSCFYSSSSSSSSSRVVQRHSDDNDPTTTSSSASFSSFRAAASSSSATAESIHPLRTLLAPFTVFVTSFFVVVSTTSQTVAALDPGNSCQTALVVMCVFCAAALIFFSLVRPFLNEFVNIGTVVSCAFDFVGCLLATIAVATRSAALTKAAQAMLYISVAASLAKIFNVCARMGLIVVANICLVSTEAELSVLSRNEKSMKREMEERRVVEEISAQSGNDSIMDMLLGRETQLEKLERQQQKKNSHNHHQPHQANNSSPITTPRQEGHSIVRSNSNSNRSKRHHHNHNHRQQQPSLLLSPLLDGSPSSSSGDRTSLTLAPPTPVSPLALPSPAAADAASGEASSSLVVFLSAPAAPRVHSLHRHRTAAAITTINNSNGVRGSSPSSARPGGAGGREHFRFSTVPLATSPTAATSSGVGSSRAGSNRHSNNSNGKTVSGGGANASFKTSRLELL